jgi:hypothetical protein
LNKSKGINVGIVVASNLEFRSVCVATGRNFNAFALGIHESVFKDRLSELDIGGNFICEGVVDHESKGSTLLVVTGIHLDAKEDVTSRFVSSRADELHDISVCGRTGGVASREQTVFAFARGRNFGWGLVKDIFWVFTQCLHIPNLLINYCYDNPTTLTTVEQAGIGQEVWNVFALGFHFFRSQLTVRVIDIKLGVFNFLALDIFKGLAVGRGNNEFVLLSAVVIVTVVDEEIGNVKTLSEDPEDVFYETPAEIPSSCEGENGLLATGDTACPSADTDVVKLISSTGDEPTGDVFFGIKMDSGNDEKGRTLRFMINNPFADEVTAYVKFGKSVFEHAFMDPKCEGIEIPTGCNADAPEFEVACHDYADVDSFALVQIYFVSSAVEGTTDIDECCKADVPDDAGVVMLSYELLCACPENNASRR